MNFMKSIAVLLLAMTFASPLLSAEPAPAKPEKKITPGQPIVPDKMRRIWGELISLDPVTRTGKFRKEDSDEVMEFVIEPYAQLMHHATNGDVQDFTPGERAIFRLHEDDAGVWRHLTYIQDEMNFLTGHKEWFYVNAIDREKGRLTCRQESDDGSFVRTPELFINVDNDTKYFRDGKPIAFADLKVGDRIKTKTRGHGQGIERTAWYVFFDQASIDKFRDEQLPVQAARMKAEGLTGYADVVDGRKIDLTMFIESGEWAKKLKPGMAGKIAPAGVDRKPTAEPIDVKVVSTKAQGSLTKVTVEASSAPPAALKPTALIRLWVPQAFE